MTRPGHSHPQGYYDLQTTYTYGPRHEKTCLRGLEISDIETRGIILSRQRTTKALSRLCRCVFS